MTEKRVPRGKLSISDSDLAELAQVSPADVLNAQTWGRRVAPAEVEGVREAPDLAFAKPAPEE